MKRYFAYIRVSTTKQGEHGSSLAEQRSAIEIYARKQGVEVMRWYEEVETAAKLGRRVFGKMMIDRRREGVTGIIFHKIDRSARHLKDWASIGDLIDEEVDVRFAHESLDLRSRGGRLAADIQAVVAADYIRNLREETRKGFYGRLKQGLYPLKAPHGYIDCGKGKPKQVDPVRGPFIQDAFEMYASGTFGLDSLREELHRRGLRNFRDRHLSRNGIATILHNPFYAGIIRLQRTGEYFDGVHQPLISKTLFDQVQLRLSGKANQRVRTHDFLFRRLLRCATCSATLIGERQKGHAYYRCHSRECKGVSVREEVVDQAVRFALSAIIFADGDFGDLRDVADDQSSPICETPEEQLQKLNFILAACDDRLIRLTDALLDGLLDREAFNARKIALLTEKAEIKVRIERVSDGDNQRRIAFGFLELAQSALLSYETANAIEKRALLKSVTSNLSVERKKPMIALRTPFEEIANTVQELKCDPHRATNRTFLQKLWVFLMEATKSEQLDPVPQTMGRSLEPRGYESVQSP